MRRINRDIVVTTTMACLVLSFFMMSGVPAFLLSISSYGDVPPSSFSTKVAMPEFRGATSLILERPRQTLSEIRTPGESFEVWVRGDGIEPTSNFQVKLIGNAHEEILPVTDLSSSGERWIIEVEISNNTLCELYDIIVSVDGLSITQINALSVIREYKAPFKFIQLTDVHIDSQNSENNLRAIVKELNIIAPEFVIITGDIYDAEPTGSTTPSQQQADILMQICSDLEVPLFCVPGNHEYGYLGAGGIEVYLNTINPILDYEFNYGSHHFITTNCGHWQEFGLGIPHTDNNVEAFTNEQIEWLTNDLVEHQNDTMRLMFNHAPLKTSNGKQMPMYHVDDVEALMEEYDVLAYIAGHSHSDEIIDADDNVLSGTWYPPAFPLFIQTDTAGQRPTIYDCAYRVFQVNNSGFDYYTYDDDGDGLRSAVSSTPAGDLSVDITAPMDGSANSTNFVVANYQNEDLVNGRVILKLQQPPNGLDYCVDSGFIENVINTDTGQELYVRVSVPANTEKLFKVVQKDILPPVISSFKCSVDGEECEIVEKGSEVLVEVLEAAGEVGLWGSVMVVDEMGYPILSNEVLSESGPGRYVYTWNTTNTLHLMNYSISVKLVDGVGNEAVMSELSKPVWNLSIRDTTSPAIASVETYLNGVSQTTCPLGEGLKVVVIEGNAEKSLSGFVIVEPETLCSSGNNISLPLLEGTLGEYYCEWDTADLCPGYYSIRVILTDDHGNSVDSVATGHLITVKLVDATAPTIHSFRAYTFVDGVEVEMDQYNLGENIWFEVVEFELEANLSGEVTITSDAGTEPSTVLTLAPMEKDGYYYAIWDTRFNQMETYSVNVTLFDKAGNIDADGLLVSPDLYVELIDGINPFVVTSDPLPGDMNVSVHSSITIIFSEKLMEGSLMFGSHLRDAQSREVPLKMEWSESSYTCIFTPQRVLTYSNQYVLTLERTISDIEGNHLKETFTLVFQTSGYLADEVFDLSHTVMPGQSRLNVVFGVNQTFNITMLSSATLALPLVYTWLIDGEEVLSGPGKESYSFNTSLLKDPRIYLLRVNVELASSNISLFYTWEVNVLPVESLDNDGDEKGDIAHQPSQPFQWLLMLGVILGVLGLLLIPLYFVVRQRGRRKEFEVSVKEYLEKFKLRKK